MSWRSGRYHGGTSCASAAAPVPGCCSSVRSVGNCSRCRWRRRSRAARSIPRSVPKYLTPLLIPPVMPRAGTITMQGRQDRRLLRDLDAAVRPAGPARGAAGNNRVGLRRKGRPEQPRRAPSSRPVADDRGAIQPARAGQMDQRTGRRERRVSPASAAGRPHPALGQPARRHRRARHATDASQRLPAGTPARCRSSPTPTAPSASATRATATPRPGTCPRRTTFPTTTPRKARGTTSSRTRRRETTPQPGVPASPRSSTRTSGGRRPRGITTTPWG